MDEPAAEPEPEDDLPPMGLLYLSSQPPCEVQIDGKDYGSTTKTRYGLILREGVYKVRFVCADDSLCGTFETRAGIKTLRVYGDRETRYDVDFYRVNRAD